MTGRGGFAIICTSMKTNKMTAVKTLVAGVALAFFAFAAVDSFAMDGDESPVMNYDGPCSIAAAKCEFTAPNGEECTLELRGNTASAGMIVVRKPGEKRSHVYMLPEGMTGGAATVRTLGDGRVMVAYVDYGSPDAATGFRMVAWVGPWESMKASSTRGFYRLIYKRPDKNGIWLPDDLKAADAKFRAHAEGLAKGTGGWDDPVTVDLTTDLSRFSTIHESEFYDAHATSVMLPDEKTMYCFWDLAHGGPTGPAAKSEDGGRTWTDISDRIPAEFRRSHDAPVAFRFVDPKTGKARLRVFAGFTEVDPKAWRGPKDRPLVEAMPSIMSEDDGKTWKYMPPMGVDFTCVISFFGMVQLKDGSYLGVFHRGPNANGDGSPLQVMSSVSRDGGLTWEKPNLVAVDKRYDLCEPAVFYSPDKAELCCLIRENRGAGLSQMCFSKDEGKTWSKLQDAPRAMNGHRHVVERLADGRYLVVFRRVDYSHPLVMGWVGPYEGIRDGSGKGGYLIDLFPNYGSPFDCGYQGMHIKKDGEIVVNTYTKFRKWANATPSIVSTHFKIEEADALVAARRAYWADQLAALDEAAQGVPPDAEKLKASARPQRNWVLFDVKAETNLTVLTEAKVYGFIGKSAANSPMQMAVLPEKTVKNRQGIVDVARACGAPMGLRLPWFEPGFTAFVKWEVESAADGERILRIKNDFYGTVFVNGEQLPSSYGSDGSRGMRPFTGNLSSGLRFKVNLKKGKNEIILMTSPGSAGQWLCAAAVEEE